MPLEGLVNRMSLPWRMSTWMSVVIAQRMVEMVTMEVLVRHYGLWINENTDPKSQLLWVLYHDCYLLVIVYLRYRSTTFQYNLPLAFGPEVKHEPTSDKEEEEENHESQEDAPARGSSDGKVSKKQACSDPSGLFDWYSCEWTCYILLGSQFG